MAKPLRIRSVLSAAYRPPASTESLESDVRDQLARLETVAESARLLTSAFASALTHGLPMPTELLDQLQGPKVEEEEGSADA